MAQIEDWSYSGDPTTSPLDEVRFLAGDTNSDNRHVADAEINYQFVRSYGSVANAPPTGNYIPAYRIAEIIAMQYATMGQSKTVGDLSISWGDRADQYRKRAAELRRNATIFGVTVWLGGTSRQEKISNISNPDRITTAVKIDGMDYADPGPGVTAPGENNVP
jgi:hypothetical protein